MKTITLTDAEIAFILEALQKLLNERLAAQVTVSSEYFGIPQIEALEEKLKAA